MTMAENVPDQTPAATPPVDYRPQPRYGELAPEGWTWAPPQDEQAPAASAALPPVSAPAQLGSAERPVPAAPGWDRPITAILLVLGLLGTYLTISILVSMPEALQMLYTQAELGTYTAADSVAAIITAGSISQVVIWLAAAASSILLVLRGRRAFYVPLIGGVVAFVLLVAAMAVVLAGDPALLDYFGQP
ncbi:DUF6264 family protein [Cryobacterium sp. SO2]|uniref:DUF6264 family protein n=1 Tax=Cryobacterium sp. SO2 TaxID=1897060 RepID=UPI00223D764E|nr:DUF6264 family protein [Cryobacterium sp. SO2]WEO76182.1 DUF6264 family protein [Cryobacterium sp. SO2]